LRQWLGNSRYVRAHNSGALDDGGDGWTVVELNADARL
jgi:dsDNA-specific endonuclease/ATPase MutS2